MSNSTKKHWQEDSDRYTFNQYVFYLIFLGLAIALLVAAYFWWLPPERAASTHLVAVTSQPGGELPAIPFQDDDYLALASTFKHVVRYSFDDAPGFDQKVGRDLVADNQETFENDSMIIWFSGVGAVVDGNPVIMVSQGNQSIPLKKVYETVAEIPIQQIALVLDCGHLLSDSDKYLGRAEDDYNDFVRLARELAPSTESGKQRLAVLFTNSIGEQPLYSTTQRRTLFGMAFEHVLESPATLDVNQLANDINVEMLKWGGQAAQECFVTGQSDPLEFDFPKLLVIDDSDPSEEGETETLEPTELATTHADALDELWKEYDIVNSRMVVGHASDFASRKWNELTLRMVRLSYANIQGQSLDERKGQLSSAIRQFDKAEVARVKATLDQYRLVADEDNPLGEKGEVIRAFLTWYGVAFRIQHYSAVFDGLSRLMPENSTLQDYRKELETLSQLTMTHASLFQTATPTADQLSDYRQAHEDLVFQESRLRGELGLLVSLSTQSLHGLEREVAVDVLLRYPFWESPPPADMEPDSPASTFPTRADVRLQLKGNKPDVRKRINLAARSTAAKDRVQWYRRLSDLFGPPIRQTEDLRMLQPFAFRFPVKDLDFRLLVVQAKTLMTRVVATNKADLTSGAGVVIERDTFAEGGTVLDLGLAIDGTATVATRFELVQSEPFFKFAGNEQDQLTVADGKIKLSAIQDAEGDQRAVSKATLRVRVFDRDNPEKEFDSFVVKLLLPSTNQVDLTIEVGAGSTSFAQTDLPNTIRPFANRESDCLFQLKNRWHQGRTLDVALYPCRGDSQTISGKVTNVVRRATLSALERRALKPLAMKQVVLGAAQSGTETQTIDWTPAEPKEGETAPALYEGAAPLPNGMLCIIRDVANQQEWQYWIETFPLEEAVVLVEPVHDGDDLFFTLERNSKAPDGDIVVKWSFSDDQIESSLATRKTLSAGRDLIARVPVLTHVSQQLKRGTYLYVDVDDWPRKYVFRYDGSTFQMPLTLNDATITLETDADKPDAPEKILQELESQDFDRMYATRATVDQVIVMISANLPSNANAFSFDTADPDDPDCILLTGSSEALKRYYPREIQTTAFLQTKSGRIRLNSNVSDFRISIGDLGSRFEIHPSTRIGGVPKELPGSNKVVALFDQRKPKIDQVNLLTTTTIKPGSPIKIGIVASDGGVGFDWESGVDFFLSDKPMKQLPKPDARESVRMTREGFYEFTGPAEENKYFIGVRITDRVGNAAEFIDSKKSVVVQIPKKTKTQEKMETAKPLVHALTIIPKVPSSTNFDNLTNPELVIEPEAEHDPSGGPEQTFTNLKPGVTYTITGRCEIKSGILKGTELLGDKVRFTVPKNLTSETTFKRPMKFTLK